MVEVNRMQLGRFEFVIDFGSFRRITACWSGPGWDINFSGACINDDPEEPTFPDSRIGVFCDAAPLPFAKAADYTGVKVVDLCRGFMTRASWGAVLCGLRRGELRGVGRAASVRRARREPLPDRAVGHSIRVSPRSAGAVRAVSVGGRVAGSLALG